MNRAIECLNNRIDKLRAERASALRNLQQVCEHTSLAECDYQKSVMTDGGALPPLRVCLECGMSEEGWGPGYVVLRGAAASISRNELYDKRAGFLIWDRHKGPLLRREVTIGQLIANSEAV
ncbi:hypothetical protein H4CHR_02940 [Variovorax sp. PBS-H4]|uniref:hypothetical protein n=1 Tax=Variovorax sp. PBS-H4 TaxID=434008 RepID=UPI001316E56A|nr:hypothetical protein [Variovorax sp. PBS-H4]VTU32091.1 hypothetical protein H4CHR_02940 [Variovorax sp. PBS-H4]